MIPPSTPEFHRDRHDAQTARLRSSMHRPPRFATRHAIGSWLVSAGLRLAPDQAAHDLLRAIEEHPEAARASGCVPA
jgi:hypothetical protein